MGDRNGEDCYETLRVTVSFSLFLFIILVFEKLKACLKSRLL